ncbi:hypothetical protein AJ80_02752 [Polytolypa hystricis UAMH7299]|uniref:Uncharacterized protein n=1 Tax=Polytolypa hystricis (strain UAMH7299) TaxID=1447883 RepID=A0A2B7YGB5_POLH7|nr:hypothetical protein AJ80_02752 [Polytolypa hystricis UAMH7299]
MPDLRLNLDVSSMTPDKHTRPAPINHNSGLESERNAPVVQATPSVPAPRRVSNLQIQTARRGGISLSAGYRIMERESRRRSKHGHSLGSPFEPKLRERPSSDARILLVEQTQRQNHVKTPASPNIAKEKQPPGSISPDDDEMDFNEAAESLLHKFLAHSGSSGRNSRDNSSSPIAGPASPFNPLKRTANGDVKQDGQQASSEQAQAPGSSDGVETISGGMEKNTSISQPPVMPSSSPGLLNGLSSLQNSNKIDELPRSEPVRVEPSTEPPTKVRPPCLSSPTTDQAVLDEQLHQSFLSSLHNSPKAPLSPCHDNSTSTAATKAAHTNPTTNNNNHNSNTSQPHGRLSATRPPPSPRPPPVSVSSPTVPRPSQHPFPKPLSPQPHSKKTKPPPPPISTRPQRQAVQKTLRANMPSSDSGSYVGSNASSPVLAPVRRSRRSRAAVGNYFDPPPGFRGFQGEDEPAEETNRVDNGDTSPMNLDSRPGPDTCVLPSAVHAPKPQQPRLIYRSETSQIQIQREPLTTPVAEVFDQNVPYHNRHARERCGELCKNLDFKGEESVVIHVGFDNTELKALYSLITDDTTPLDDDNDIPFQDILIQTVYRFRPDELPSLASRFDKLRRLQSLLPSDTDTDLEELFFNSRRGLPSVLRSYKSGTIRRISEYVSAVFNADMPDSPKLDARVQLQVVLQRRSEEDIHTLARWIALSAPLCHRRRSDIRAVLLDMHSGSLPSPPFVLRAQPFQKNIVNFYRPSARLQARELGYKPCTNARIERKLGPWKSWKGASNDVMLLSWSSDGTRFAAGATAQCDEHHMQYNRNNNLLLGDLVCESLRELPDHHIPRQSNHTTADPNLYMTMTGVKWQGDRLFTASYDQTVKIWDVTTHTGTRCINSLRHPGKVQVMAVSNSSELIATACENNHDPLMTLWRISEDGHSTTNTALDLVKNRPKNISVSPTCLSWGSSTASHFLAAGLGCADDDNGDPSKEGHLAIWQLTESGSKPLHLSPNSQNIFDIAWHPTLPIFASGSSAPTQVQFASLAKDTRTVVRVYAPLSGTRSIVEYDCPALDINEVTFCPSNSNYVTASCTNGVTYVWDFRNPHRILHKLSHGKPISELDQTRTREQADSGVRLALWKGKGVDQFYTGSSDGVLKEWNVLSAPEDVLVDNVASFNQEIMSGAFSPDCTNLLVGDTCGGLHVLSSAPFSHNSTMNYESTTIPEVPKEMEMEMDIDPRGIANDLLSSGKLSRHPIFGVGKGPAYTGPYAAWARPQVPKEVLAVTPLNPIIQAQQLHGPPPQHRRVLNEKDRKELSNRIELSRIRNKLPGEHKRKREQVQASSPLPPPPKTAPVAAPRTSVLGHPPPAPPPHTPQAKVISLVSDDDDDEDEEPVSRVARPLKQVKQAYIMSFEGPIDFIDLTGDATGEEEDDNIDDDGSVTLDGEIESLCERLEEDYWWPRDVDANIRDPDG